jgi:antitoxin ParD1/3/4
MSTLTISLPKPLKEFVDNQVAAGTHGNASAFIAALLRAERRRKAEEELVALVKQGDDSGPSTPWTSEDLERVRGEVMKRLAAEKEKHAKGRKKTRSRT